jgi:hypothetical protein
MKRIITIFCLIFLVGSTGKACDACGCKLSGLSFGIMPQYDTHFIGLRYSHARFTADIDYPYLEDEHSSDSYQKVELIGRYNISKKIKANVVVPYMYNEMNGSQTTSRIEGLSDAMVVFYYNLFNTSDNKTSVLKQSMLVGAGVKLPTGKYQQQESGQLLNPNFQLGSGSLDYLLSVNYTMRYKSIGMNVESSYKINSTNKYDYRFGNQFNSSGYLFYFKETKLVAILPYAGLFYEQAKRHNDGGVDRENSGGSAMFATLGAQLYKGKFTFMGQYQLPIAQNYNSEKIATITAHERITFGLMFNFSFREMKSSSTIK